MFAAPEEQQAAMCAPFPINEQSFKNFHTTSVAVLINSLINTHNVFVCVRCVCRVFVCVSHIAVMAFCICAHCSMLNAQ